MKPALFALLLVACSAPGVGRQPTVIIDEDFGARTAEVIDGVAGWERANIKPGFILLRHADVISMSRAHEPGTAYLIATQHFVDCPAPPISASAFTTVYENGSATTCFDLVPILSPRAPANEVRRAAAHEFGHALGLPHRFEADSVMLPQFAGVDTPSPGDLDALR